MRKLYVLSFGSDVNSVNLHNSIKNSALIYNWSHYLTDSYILQSDSSARQLSMDLREKYGGNFTHFIFKLDKDFFGHMPKKQWEWLDGTGGW